MSARGEAEEGGWGAESVKMVVAGGGADYRKPFVTAIAKASVPD